MNGFTSVKIEFYIPENNIEKIRDELAKMNVGRIGNYDHCLSITNVRGYWRPLAGSNPHIGEVGQVSGGEESKVEINCALKLAAEAVKVIRMLHPYDEPLINVIPLLNEQYGGAV